VNRLGVAYAVPSRDFRSGSDDAALWVPGKLWSLLDMLKFNGSSFFEAVSITSAARSTMRRRVDQGEGDKTLSPSDNKNAPRTLKNLQEHTKRLGAKVTEMAVAELLTELRKRKKPISLKHLTDRVSVVENTLRRELSLIHLLVLDGDTQKYFAPNEPLFGDEFAVKFPSATVRSRRKRKMLSLRTANCFCVSLDASYGNRRARCC
jgi:hypothetical protein